MKRYLANERGVAALIGITLTSLLIAILVTATVKLMVGELRQSTDAENNVRAYYLAQSGQEEAVRAIIQQLVDHKPLTFDQGCDQDKFSSSPLATGPTSYTFAAGLGSADATQALTCRQITTRGPVRNRTQVSDQSDQYDLSNAVAYGGVTHMKLSWDAANKTATSPDYSLPNLSQLPDAITRSTSQAPPLMEVKIVYFNADGSNAHTVTRLLNPSTETGSQTTIPITTSAAASGLTNVTCKHSSSVRDCNVDLVLNQGSSERVLVRIRPRYSDTVYDLTPYVPQIGGGEQVYQMPLSTAQIDVTSRVGSTYRRLSTAVPIRTTPYSGIDDVLYSDTNLCKNLQLFEAPGYNGSADQITARTSCPFGGSSVSNGGGGASDPLTSLAINGSSWTSCTQDEDSQCNTFGAPNIPSGSSVYNMGNFHVTYPATGLSGGDYNLTLNYSSVNNGSIPQPSASVYSYKINIAVNGVIVKTDQLLSPPSGTYNTTLSNLPDSPNITIYWTNNQWVPANTFTSDPNLKIDSLNLSR